LTTSVFYWTKGRGLKTPFILLSLFWLIILFLIFEETILHVLFPLLGPICKENLFYFKPLTWIDENASSITLQAYFKTLSLFKIHCWLLPLFNKILYGVPVYPRLAVFFNFGDLIPLSCLIYDYLSIIIVFKRSI
jgi:hypothetical protein